MFEDPPFSVTFDIKRNIFLSQKHFLIMSIRTKDSSQEGSLELCYYIKILLDYGVVKYIKFDRMVNNKGKNSISHSGLLANCLFVTFSGL